MRKALMALVLSLGLIALAIPAGAQAFIYWGNGNSTTIGRANLNGTAVNTSFINGANDPCGVAVDGSNIYWANFGPTGTRSAAQTSTARDVNDELHHRRERSLRSCRQRPARLLGQRRQRRDRPRQSRRHRRRPELHHPRPRDDPCGVAVDGGHVYWASQTGTTIGRANLDGTGVDQSFIGGANRPCGVAVDGADVYWSTGASVARSARRSAAPTSTAPAPTRASSAGRTAPPGWRSTPPTSTGPTAAPSALHHGRPRQPRRHRR